MRIISGSHKGHIIRPPKGLPIRPTTDISKEGLFNILNNEYYFEDSRVLDLFSGGGTITLEFLSRGAVEVHSVDKHPGCAGFLKEEAKKLGFTQHQMIRADVMQYLKTANEAPFDIIFCDPPYAWGKHDELAVKIFESNILAKDGVCIIEHHSVTSMNQHIQCYRQRAFGQNVLSFFKHPQTEAERKEEKEEE